MPFQYITGMRLLLVEDDPELAAILTSGFREHGIDVVHASTFAAGRTLAVMGSYDIMLLDVMLPGGSGFDLCRIIRESGVETPILMLTARDAVDDRVAGLEAGADDYLTKPFAFRELLARVRALSRRVPSLIPRKVAIADLEVDLSARRAVRAGKPIDLTAKEFSLLEFLATHKDIVVDRTAITAHVSPTRIAPRSISIRRRAAELASRFDSRRQMSLVLQDGGSVSVCNPADRLKD